MQGDNQMEKTKEYYSIGEVSRLCNVSRKALRFYDEIGLIRPDKVGNNNYRFYSREALLNLTVLKYYKQMGFKLEELRSLLITEEYSVLEHGFLEKIEELHSEQIHLEAQLTSVQDWYSLLLEAQTVIMNNATEVSMKYIEPGEYGYMDQDYMVSAKEAVINLKWMEFLDQIDTEITGPVMLEFPSYKERMAETCKSMRILQKMIQPKHKEYVIQKGGCMMLSCYHIGSHKTLAKTYEKMEKWAKAHDYILGESCWERFVTDFWTTKNDEMFVTEIRMDAHR